MTQRRYVEFGTAASASKIVGILKQLAEPGLLSGGKFFVEAGEYIKIEPFSVITADGVIITEDTYTRHRVPLTPTAHDYTVVLEHDYQELTGGTPATVMNVDGIQTVTDMQAQNKVVLGWVRYPGGSVPHLQKFFTTRNPSKLSEPNTKFDMAPVLPPFQPFVTLAGDVTITTQFDGIKSFQQIKALSYTTHDFVFPLRVGSVQPAKVITVSRVSVNAAVTVSIISPAGVEIALGGQYYFTNDGDEFKTREAIIPQLTSVFPAGSICHIKFHAILQTNERFDLAGFWATTHNFPY